MSIDKKKDLRAVDDLTSKISNEFGRLVSYGVFTFEEGSAAVLVLTMKQKEWMDKNFSAEEIEEFMSSKLHFESSLTLEQIEENFKDYDLTEELKMIFEELKK